MLIEYILHFEFLLDPVRTCPRLHLLTDVVIKKKAQDEQCSKCHAYFYMLILTHLAETKQQKKAHIRRQTAAQMTFLRIVQGKIGRDSKGKEQRIQR